MKKLLAVLVLAVLSIAAAPTSPVEDEIRTRKLVLVDAAGKVRATLSTGGAGDIVSLAMRTPAGDGLINIGLWANGNAQIGIDDAKGARILMAMNNSGGGLVVYDARGNAVHTFTSPR